MEEFNYSSTYRSGWRQVKREETENESQRVMGFPKKKPDTPIRNAKPLCEDSSPMKAKMVENAITIPVFEEKQKEIMEKINQLQTEMALMKQILQSIQTNTEIMSMPNQKKATGGKFPKLFK